MTTEMPRVSKTQRSRAKRPGIIQCQGYEWHCFDYGLNILNLAFVSPRDLICSILEGELEGDALRQAKNILMCLRDIAPPRRAPEKWEFIVRLRERGDVEYFRVVRRGSGQLGPSEFRTTRLNIAPREFFSLKGEKRLMRKFYRTFFGGVPTFDQMATFILSNPDFLLDEESLFEAHEAF